MASETRNRIVDSARQLFWEQGFESTTLAQIAERSEAMPGSIYYFFKTKEAILLAVIDHYDQQLGAWLIDPVFHRTDDPVERIFGVIDAYRSFLVETHFTLGCPVGGLALELGEDFDEARARLKKIFDDLATVLAACAERVVRTAPPGAPEADALAALCLTVIEGGIVQARALQTIEPFDASVACLRDYVERIGA